MVASAEGHAQALANVVQANLEAVDLIRNDRNGLWIGSEGFDIPVAVTDTPDAAAEVARERALGWLVWDLHFGVDPGVAGYFDMVETQQLDRIRTLAASDGLVAGLDIYPISVNAIGGVRPDWSTEELIHLAEEEIARWHDRYDQPFWIAGGVGVTPFLGAAAQSHPHRHHIPRLAYCIRSRLDAPGLDDLEAAHAAGRIELHLFVSSGGCRLDEEAIQSLLSGIDPTATHVVMCGPTSLVRASTDMLHRLGVQHVHVEGFDIRTGIGPNLSRQVDRLLARWIPSLASPAEPTPDGGNAVSEPQRT